MEEKELNFEQDVKINPNELDIAYLEQGQLEHDYSNAATEAKDEMRRAEQRMKVVRSRLILEASEKGEEVLGKGVKPTGQTIEAYYRTHKDHQKAKEEYFKALKKSEMLTGAMFSILNRKECLEGIFQLFKMNYCAVPTVPRDLIEEWHKYLNQKKEDDKKEVNAKFLARKRRRERMYDIKEDE